MFERTIIIVTIVWAVLLAPLAGVFYLAGVTAAVLLRAFMDGYVGWLHED